MERQLYRDNIHDLERTSMLRHMILKKLLIPFNLLRAFLLAQISNESSRQINAYQNRHFTCDLKSARNKTKDVVNTYRTKHHTHITEILLPLSMCVIRHSILLL